MSDWIAIAYTRYTSNLSGFTLSGTTKVATNAPSPVFGYLYRLQTGERLWSVKPVHAG